MVPKANQYTQNRELSWLKFNQRVLEEAADSSVPLLERLKFVAIFTSNLDEFYMVRCGSLYDLSLINDGKIDPKSGMRPSEQLEAIFLESRHLYLMRDQIYKALNNTLYELQISEIGWKMLTKKQQRSLTHYFDQEILPLLSAQVIDFHRPFPHLVNKELYVIAQLMENGTKKYGIVPIPSYIERLIPVPESKGNYILAEQVIFHNLHKVFGKSQILFKTIIRVTRNADINLNAKDVDEDVDYRGYMKKILKRRSRLSPMRLEIYKYTNEEVIDYLCKQLKIKRSQVFVSRVPLEMKHLFKAADQVESSVSAALLYKPFEPQGSKYIDPDKPILPQVFARDILLNYPYQDIGIFLNLLKEASQDPNVVSIKITIYRLADHSKIVNYLCQAADNGKEVTVLMELRARFDESHNIQAAERLEEAGCNVIYGFEDYKVHSKICLITYKTRKGIQYITQIGTGNYNEKTSRQYTDLTYITSNPEIGKDAAAFFQNMAISNLNGSYTRLLTSPVQLKQMVMHKLDGLIALARDGKKAKAMFKLNAITDLDMINKLAQASQAGVEIVMVIRGICCILPGMEGLTENIEVFSIVGRFLEHSRIYVFESEGASEVYISSADFMTRNTERRVEVAVPILDPKLKKDILDYFNALLKDNTKRRRLMSNGSYTAIDQGEESPFNSQEYEIELHQKEHFIKEESRPAWLTKLLAAFRK